MTAAEAQAVSARVANQPCHEEDLPQEQLCRRAEGKAIDWGRGGDRYGLPEEDGPGAA